MTVRISAALAKEIEADPWGYALRELDRIDREAREQHAKFQAAIAGPRKAFEDAMTDATGEK